MIMHWKCDVSVSTAHDEQKKNWKIIRNDESFLAERHRKVSETSVAERQHADNPWSMKDHIIFSLVFCSLLECWCRSFRCNSIELLKRKKEERRDATRLKTMRNAQLNAIIWIFPFCLCSRSFPLAPLSVNFTMTYFGEFEMVVLGSGLFFLHRPKMSIEWKYTHDKRKRFIC